MSNQPFGQAPAFGSPPPSPVDAPPVDETPVRSNRTRTLVIAAVAGVAALGVLGGAVVLTGTDDPVEDSLALPAASTVPVEPSAAPTAVSTPLPTAVVRSRNVFVPLVEEGGTDAEASAAPEPAAAQPTGTATQATSGGTSFTPLPGSTTGSRLLLPAPTVTVTEAAADDELVANLRRQVADLQGLLDALDDSATEERDDLLAEIDRLQKLIDAAGEAPAYDAEIHLETVDPDEDTADGVLVLAVNGEEVTLDLDESDDTHPISTPLWTTRSGSGVPIDFVYVGYDENAKLVSFTIASELYQATLGTTLVYSR